MKYRIALGILVATAGGIGFWGCSGSTSSDGGNPGTDAAAGDATAGDTGGGVGDAGKDSNLPDTNQPDTAPSPDGGVACGTTTCTGTNVCCARVADGGGTLACADSCDGGGVIACVGAENCTGAAKLCCAQFTSGPGTPPNCPAKSVSSSCQATCVTNIQQTCDTTSTVRLCLATADCADDPQYNKCCEFTQAGQKATFCVDQATSLFANQCY